MKIDKKFLELLTGSLSKEKIEGESQEFESIFNIVNKLNPYDNKIDIEEITEFVMSIWHEDDGDKDISDQEIENFLQKNKDLFEKTGVKAGDVRSFFEFFIKNSTKRQNSDKRLDNGDGTFSLFMRREKFEEQEVLTNKKEIDSWDQNSVGSRPKPKYKTVGVLKGIVDRKVNYDSDNRLISAEETFGSTTTFFDAEGNKLRSVTKNQGAKDTIREYVVLDDGTEEESVFFGENREKDTEIPIYKNVYKNKELIARYVPDENGQFVQRQNMEKGIVTSVTKLNNGVESETVALYTNTYSFDYSDRVFDNVIDPVKQNITGNCWLLDGLSLMGKNPWGRQLIKDAVTVDEVTGNITVKFKHAYGETKEFIITPNDIDAARQAVVKKYPFNDLPKGMIVYIDGKKELVLPKKSDFFFNSEQVKDNITFELPNGQKFVWPKIDLENANSGVGGPKYSSGDLTVLAIELAVERSRKEAGFKLGNGGYLPEVLALFSDIDNFMSIKNMDISEPPDPLYTQTERREEYLHNKVQDKQTSHIKKTSIDANTEQIVQKLKQISKNPDKYITELGIKVGDTGLHTAQMVRLEERKGKMYIVYNTPWDEKAEITEELNSFCKNKLYELEIIENEDYVSDLVSDADSKIGDFSTSRKTNKTNFDSAIVQLSQNAEFSPDIQKEDENYVISIKDKKIVVSSQELETARASGRYSAEDDDMALLEIATERYINNKMHNNSLDYFEHTDLEDVSVNDILNLFSERKLKQKQLRNIGEVNPNSKFKFAVTKKWDGALQHWVSTYYSIKEIKQTPNGQYLISVVQPEDTSVVVTYTEAEYKKIFNRIEVYN